MVASLSGLRWNHRAGYGEITERIMVESQSGLNHRAGYGRITERAVMESQRRAMVKSQSGLWWNHRLWWKLFLFIRALHAKGFASKRTELKVNVLQDLGKILFAGVCLHFKFSLKILQAWVVKGLRVVLQFDNGDYISPKIRMLCVVLINT